MFEDIYGNWTSSTMRSYAVLDFSTVLPICHGHSIILCPGGVLISKVLNTGFWPCFGATFPKDPYF